MSSYIPRSLLDQAKPEQSDPTYRASMLPIGTYPNSNGSGEHLGFAVPGMIQEPMNALMRLIGTPSNPGTFTQGPGYGSNADDMRTLLETFLGGQATRGMGAGSVAARALSDTTPSLPGAVVAGAERNPTSAANHYNIHNPPRMPERPFEEDYPNGAQANDLGLLQFDMEGRPLQAQYVVGRNALGGPDRAFPSSQLDDLTEKLLSRSPQSVAPGDIPGIAAFGPGRTNQVGSAGNLYVDRTLPSPTRERAIAHELGHALDHITNSETRVPPRVGAHGNETNLLNDEYGQIYHDLASPDDASRGEARAARDRISPANFGYPTDQHDAEYLAEAFRAYMTDPNYMKTVAPTAAARLRSYVNAHPDLSKIIQFNSDQLPSIWGAAVAGQQNPQYPNSLFTY